MKQYEIPRQYADYYYLRSFDLVPERLGDCPPFNLVPPQCEEFVKQGWLFRTKEEAWEVYRKAVMAAGREDSLRSL